MKPDNVAVVFGKDGVRIYHGVDPLVYSNRDDALLNPEYPKDKDGHLIPPHLWKKVGNKITSEEQQKPAKSFKKYYLAAVIVLVALSVCLIYTLW